VWSGLVSRGGALHRVNLIVPFPLGQVCPRKTYYGYGYGYGYGYMSHHTKIADTTYMYLVVFTFSPAVVYCAEVCVVYVRIKDKNVTHAE